MRAQTELRRQLVRLAHRDDETVGRWPSERAWERGAPHLRSEAQRRRWERLRRERRVTR